MKKVFFFLAVLLIALPAISNAGDKCGIPSNKVQVLLKQETDLIFSYEIINLYTEPIYSFYLGDPYAEIEEWEDVPKTISGPEGWGSEKSLTPGADYIYYSWESTDRSYDIAPNSSLGGFKLEFEQAPQINVLKRAFKIVFRNGKCAEGKIEFKKIKS